MLPIPEIRVRAQNPMNVAEGGEFVLYWMIAQRRASWNFALDHAIAWAQDLGKPLVVLDALRCGYRWASDRLHRFVLQGMADNRVAFEESPVTYLPYVEDADGAGSGLLEALARRSAVIVTDDFPCFFLPRMVASAAQRVPCRLESVDGNGLLPLRATDRVFSRAYDFRRYLQKNLPEHLLDRPSAKPLADLDLAALDAEALSDIQDQWSMATPEDLEASAEFLARLPIDHGVQPVDERGGAVAASQALERFVVDRLDRYGEGRNDVVERSTSELSPYLHFGHISAHQVFAAVTEQEGWNPGRLSSKTSGQRSGWWGMSDAAESFLDELVTWREVGYNMTSQVEGYDTYESLPDWARKTLEEHRADERLHVYSLEEFESARTHDELWNAAQRELRREGRIHNYLRMLWGKKILEWTSTPREALAVMIELNNKYALDGRNPNSYSGIFWCLGRYDRAWGPERPIFGKIRFMSSDSTRRKLDAKAYMQLYGPLFGH